MNINTLSDREKEVLHWLALGHNNRGIAKVMNLSQNTIKTHITNALSKLGIPKEADEMNPRVTLARYGWEAEHDS